MAIGDVHAVADCTDVYYVDTGMYGTAEYGVAYAVDAPEPALIETGIGADRERVFALLDAVGIDREELATVAVTHVHLDHAGGAGFLAAACPNATVYAHELGAPHLVDPGRLVAGTKEAVGEQWEFYAEPEPVPADRVVELTDGDAVDLGDRSLVAHHAPGHAPHQVVFHDDRDDALFTGDAAGIWMPAREAVHPTSPPPNFELQQCLADVRAIEELGPETLLYTHFGPGPDDVAGALTSYRDVLAEWVAAVEAARQELDDEAAVVERLAAETDTEELWGERKARAETALNVRGVLNYLRGREDA
jgi:glyoxylase-like metal-dependent hydrolase (beta-lactamase superfamily II)